MKRIGIVLSVSCTVALVAALVPAVASGVSIDAPSTAGTSIDDRKKPKPTKTPKPSKSPKPTPPKIAQVPEQARAIEKWIKAQPKTYEQATSTFDFTVDPELARGPWERMAVDTAKAAFEVHALLGQPVTRPYRVYVGWDRPWLERTVPKDACPVIFEFATAAACQGSNVIYTRFALNKSFNASLTPLGDPGPNLRFNTLGLVGHELTHHVQQSLYPRKPAPSPEAGKWMIEGWAVMTQTMIAMQYNKIPYTQARDHALRLMDASCTGTKLRDLLAPTFFTNCVYVSGFLAMEYLMWKTGDMKAGWTWVSQDSATAREGFSQAFGMDLDTFMEEADAYVKQEQLLWPWRSLPQS